MPDTVAPLPVDLDALEADAGHELHIIRRINARLRAPIAGDEPPIVYETRERVAHAALALVACLRALSATGVLALDLTALRATLADILARGKTESGLTKTLIFARERETLRDFLDMERHA